MEEKTYKLMSRSGTMTMVFGILAIVLGTAMGVTLIVNGAKLLAGRKKIIF
ncbi:MAG: hypothetical protein IJQ12_09605 [Lachnospiraceae bacterium]|nr:hypothetical protein [Lachnospiraceae bacterium]